MTRPGAVERFLNDGIPMPPLIATRAQKLNPALWPSCKRCGLDVVKCECEEVV